MKPTDDIAALIDHTLLKPDATGEDIRQVVRAAGGRTVKVIIETALLTDEEKVKACNLARWAGAHFVKISTGFGGGGATAQAASHRLQPMQRSGWTNTVFIKSHPFPGRSSKSGGHGLLILDARTYSSTTDISIVASFLEFKRVLYWERASFDS